MLRFCPMNPPPTEPVFAQAPPSSDLYGRPTAGITPPPTSPRDSNLPPNPISPGRTSPRLPRVHHQNSGNRRVSLSQLAPMPAGGYKANEPEWSGELQPDQRRPRLCRRGQSLPDIIMLPQHIIPTIRSTTKIANASPKSVSPSYSYASSPSSIASLGRRSPPARSSYPG